MQHKCIQDYNHNALEGLCVGCQIKECPHITIVEAVSHFVTATFKLSCEFTLPGFDNVTVIVFPKMSTVNSSF